MNLMFETTTGSDGLEYVNPLPTGHMLYRIRDLVAKIGRVFDRFMFW